MKIGCYNVFEVDCTVEASQIGDNNVFESKCFVGNKVSIPNGCIIGAGCKLLEGKTLTNNTIVHGAKCQFREGFSQPLVSCTNISIQYLYAFVAATSSANGNPR